MGRCESAAASIGIKILLSELVSQINETNFHIIIEMLEEGFVEDDNDYFNDVYQRIIDSDKVTDNNNFSDVKKHLTNEFKTKGTVNRYKFSSREEPTLSSGCLFDKYLLVPVKKILRTDRWGYDRYGTNCSSRPMDFDLSVDIEKYKDIKNVRDKIVFILSHHSS